MGCGSIELNLVITIILQSLHPIQIIQFVHIPGTDGQTNYMCHGTQKLWKSITGHENDQTYAGHANYTSHAGFVNQSSHGGQSPSKHTSTTIKAYK